MFKRGLVAAAIAVSAFLHTPAQAGPIIDAIRACKIAMDRGIGGPIISASSYLMKSPPVQIADDEGRRRVEAFIRGDE